MTEQRRYSDYQRIIGNGSEEISINTLYPDPVRDEQGRIVKLRPLVSSVSSREAAQILRPFVSSRFMEQFKAVVPLAVYLVLFQLLILRQLVEDSWMISAGLLAVIIGLMFFMEGLKLGLMPFGSAIGTSLPRKSSLPVVLIIIMLLGVGVTFAEPAISALKAELLDCAVLHADETPVATLAPGTGKTHRSYLWAYAAGEFETLKAVVYDFTPSRAGEHARRFLGGWQGSLVCDDFAGYKASFAQGVIEVGCMAHARRKFVELHLAKKSHIAATPLALIGQLYGIERELKDKPPATRLAQRQARAAPLAAKLHEWLVLHRIKVPDGTAIAKAIDYSLNRWVALTRYLADPALPIDNNHDEQQIRPWATGRNYVQSVIMLSRRQRGLKWQWPSCLPAAVAGLAYA